MCSSAKIYSSFCFITEHQPMYIFLNTISVHRGYWWVIWSWSFGSIASRSHSWFKRKIVRSWPKITLVVGSDFGDLLGHNHWVGRRDLRLAEGSVVEGAAVLVAVSVDATVHPAAPGDKRHMLVTWARPTDRNLANSGPGRTLTSLRHLNDQRMTKVYEVWHLAWETLMDETASAADQLAVMMV